MKAAATPRGIRARVEHAFDWLGRALCARAWWVLAASVALTTAMAAQLPSLGFDTSTDGFVKPEDPLRRNYDAFRRAFGRDELVLVSLRPREVFDLEFLKLLKAIHRDLEDNVPRLDEVTSLVNARNTYGIGDVLAVDDLLIDLPETPDAMARLREQVMSDPIYRDLWISDDGRIVTLAVESDAFDRARVDLSMDDAGFAQDGFDDDVFEEAAATAEPATQTAPPALAPLRSEHEAEIVNAVKAITAKYRSPDLEMWIGGSPVMSARLLLAMERDLGRLTSAAIVLIAVLLFAVFRRASGVVLPLVVVTSSIVAMLGAMAWLGIDVAFGTQILPSAILAVGVGYTVHLLTIFFRRFDETRDRHGAIAYAVGHSGVGITLSAVTTAIGFGSFIASDVLPLYSMGCVAPAGVAFAYLFAIATLPALLAVLPLRTRPLPSGTASYGIAGRILLSLGEFSHRRAGWVTLAAAGATVVALALAATLRFGQDPMKWLPTDDRVRVDHDFLEEALDGTMVMEMVLDFHRENALHDPAILKKIDVLARYAESRPSGDVHVGKTLSIVDIAKEVHQALHSGQPEFYAIPEDERTVGQEMLLFENSGTDDLEKATNSLFSTARLTMKVGWTDSTYYPAFIERMETRARELFGSDVSLYTTGLLPMMARTTVNVMESAAKAYVAAFAIITPLMILLIGRLRAGIVSMFPNLFPIIATLGFMGALRIELDMFTILVGSIALGLAVDNTIHFVHGFSRSHALDGDAAAAIAETMRTAGRAMLFTTVVLCAGFSVFMLSELNNLFLFGALTSTAIGVALIADVLVTPALLSLTARSAPARADDTARAAPTGIRQRAG